MPLGSQFRFPGYKGNHVSPSPDWVMLACQNPSFSVHFVHRSNALVSATPKSVVRPSMQARIRALSSGLQGKDFVALIASTIAINLIVLAIPLYINRIYTSVVPEQAGDSLAGITILLAAVLVLDVVLKALRSWVLTWLGASTEHRLRMEAVRAVLGASAVEVAQQPLQARMAQLRSPTLLRSNLEQQWLVRHVDLPFSLVYLIALGLIGGWLILPPILLAPVFVLMAKRAAHEAACSTRHHHDLEVNRNQLVVNGLALASTIKTLNLEGFLIRRLEPLQERLSRRSFEQESATAKLQNLSALFSQLNQLLIVSIGGWLVIQQDLTTGALAACTLLSGQVAAPLGKLFSADGQLANQQQATLDYQQLLNLPQESNLLVGWDQRNDNATLCFAGQVLRPGETLLLLGGSPGQSTSLLDSIHAANGDDFFEIKFADQSLAAFRKTWLRRQLVRLKPEPQPFRGTLLESMTGFEVNTRAADALALCELHGVSTLIKTLPRGYDTTIGEMQDYPLAVGLRFRMSVIQALLDSPVALILDGTFPQVGTDALQWLLGLDIDCARLIALQNPPVRLPEPVRRITWQGDRLVEVSS